MDRRSKMDRTLNIDHIRRKHRDAKFLNQKGEQRKRRIKQIQEKYTNDK